MFVRAIFLTYISLPSSSSFSGATVIFPTSILYVSNLIRKYFEEGLASVAEKHYRGNRRNMSAEQEAEFLEQYRHQAEQGHVLNIQEIAKAYEKEVGHSVGNSQIYRVLHRHEWRKVMPRSKHPKKASEEEIAASKN